MIIANTIISISNQIFFNGDDMYRQSRRESFRAVQFTICFFSVLFENTGNVYTLNALFYLRV